MTVMYAVIQLQFFVGDFLSFKETSQTVPSVLNQSFSGVHMTTELNNIILICTGRRSGLLNVILPELDDDYF